MRHRIVLEYIFYHLRYLQHLRETPDSEAEGVTIPPILAHRRSDNIDYVARLQYTILYIYPGRID